MDIILRILRARRHGRNPIGCFDGIRRTRICPIAIDNIKIPGNAYWGREYMRHHHAWDVRAVRRRNIHFFMNIETLPCVPQIVRGKPRYVGDMVIRHYRTIGLSALLRDLGSDPNTPELTIVGGIGTLTMRANGSETWEPTIPGAVLPPGPPPPPPRPADEATAAARRSACSACDSWTDRCDAAGCGCTGEGRPDVWSSRCPRGKWPAAVIFPANQPMQ